MGVCAAYNELVDRAQLLGHSVELHTRTCGPCLIVIRSDSQHTLAAIEFPDMGDVDGFCSAALPHLADRRVIAPPVA